MLALLVISMVLTCTQRTGPSPESSDNWYKTPVTPEAVIDNFFYLYNFKEGSLDVEVAIDSYRDCFVENDQGYQYGFKYWDNGGAMVGYMTYAEEITCTANMFRKIANDGIHFDMVNFFQLKDTIETAEDTSQHVHPGEDWYVYRIAVTFYIDDPSGYYLYKVEGDAEFYIRQCSDGFYRIIRWIDFTHEGIGNIKAKAGMQASGLRVYSWGEVKAMYENLYSPK